MATPLQSGQRWQFAAGVAALACVYIFLPATEFAASVFASSPELPSLQRAVRLSPANADYRHRLGRYFAFVAADPQSAIESFRAAVRLNPPHAPYLVDLAAAYPVIAGPPRRRAALGRALSAQPPPPPVALGG